MRKTAIKRLVCAAWPAEGASAWRVPVVHNASFAISLASFGVACVISAARGEIQFTDVTLASGLDGYVHTPNYLAVPGVNEWFQGGVGVADFNGDGWPDIFIPKGGVGADRLYQNNGNGTFTNVAGSAGVAVAHAANGVSCADFDRDGDVDIYVTSYGTATDNLGQPGKNRLYRNDSGRFVEVAGAVGLAFTAPNVAVGDSAAWGDYDLDGDLDLAVAGWSSTGIGNRLFRNDGGVFVDVTVAYLSPVVSWGFQPTFVDTTGDGWPELLLAADFETSRAWRNTRDAAQPFVAATSEFGLGLDRNGMGACVADFDRNGTPDYYVTSIYAAIPPKGDLNGNALYMNSGVGLMTEAAASSGCDDGGWGWGAMAADFDHDGWEDIVEVNGRNSNEWANEPEYIFRNLGHAPPETATGPVSFERLGAETGFALAADARSVVTLDYDRDGDLDILVFVTSGPLKLFRNETVTTSGGRPWLMLDVRASSTARNAPHGIGAVVECVVDGVTHRRWVHSGSGFHSSAEPLVHFGFPTGSVADTIRVHWPSGQTSTLEAVALRTRVTVESPRPSDLDGDGMTGASDLGLLLAEWGATDRGSRAMRRADVDHDGVVGASDLSLVLLGWGT